MEATVIISTLHIIAEVNAHAYPISGEWEADMNVDSERLYIKMSDQVMRFTLYS